MAAQTAGTDSAQPLRCRSIRPESGTYALILSCSTQDPVQIGKLGRLQLQPGFYVYVGSARGPGGVRARLAHHRQRARRPHWHIDYLRARVRLEQIWYCRSRACREHQWARVIRSLAAPSIPLAGFGSSDCQCQTHLFFFAERPRLRDFRQRVRGHVQVAV